MKTPCELVVGRILPALKASIVKELSKKYHMKQAEIARKVGITQASVSQYLSSARGGGPRVMEDFPEIKAYASEISARIAAGESRSQWYGVLCKACNDIRKGDEFCKMRELQVAMAGCDICSKPKHKRHA